MKSVQFTYLAFLFPAIPLMMFSFGNRWILFSWLIWKVHAEFKYKKFTFSNRLKNTYLAQIKVLNKRLKYIKLMQLFSGFSFLLNLLNILTKIFSNKISFFFFKITLLSFYFSILIFLFDIQISSSALKTHLQDLGKKD